MEQPTNPHPLSKFQISRLQKLQVLRAHDKRVKFAGSKQDIYIDKDTGELWVGRKHSPNHYDPLYINPRERGISGF